MNLIRRQCKPVRRWFPRSADRHTDVTFGRVGARVSSTPVWARCAVRQSSQPNDIESRTGEGAVMHCPFCRHPDSRVVDSREADEGQAIRRRRSCPECGRRFTTVETAVLAVVKRSGVTEPFSRDKVVKGVRRACQGRDVDDDALNLLAQQVEDAVRAAGSPEIPSNEVGLAILGPLRDLDEVAYLRFASVYRGFSSAEDFEREIAALRAHRDAPAES
ncbi:transcriptional regulator NrdR [Mycobacteroides abscessus subsp. abscessus]|nr:transcriptional regulator NrdR [Mycobacteroides abscessus subsp. abscessus]